MSYTSPPVRKQCPHDGTISELYKPTFHSGHLSHNTSHGSAATPPDIPSSTVEILLFNSVFHDGVTPVSVSTLKPPLGAIGVLPLKL